jgi:hypothetical protein
VRLHREGGANEEYSASAALDDGDDAPQPRRVSATRRDCVLRVLSESGASPR